MEKKDRIKPTLLIRGNLACREITGGDFCTLSYVTMI